MKNRSHEKQGKPIRIITHQHPDTDAWLCAWLLCCNNPGRDCTLDFVPAGTCLPDDHPAWKTHEVIHVDTGGGKYDQHGKELEDSSSFELLVEDLCMRGDAAVQKLLPLANAADNARPIDPTSIHFLFTALPYCMKVKSGRKWEKRPDWAEIANNVFFVLDTMAAKWRADAKTTERFKRIAQIETLPNGLRFCALPNEPGLRVAAYDAGADVVAWTAPTNGGFNPAVQVSEAAAADLTPLIGKLRAAEAELRAVDVNGCDINQFREVPGIPGWFLHDSRRFLGSGTKTHPLTGDDLTKIKATIFFMIVRGELGKIEFGTR